MRPIALEGLYEWLIISVDLVFLPLCYETARD